MDLSREVMAAILGDIGWRFRERHPVGKYRIDFLAHAEKVVIDIGPENERDSERDRWLVKRGFQIARFTIEQVLEYPRRVKATLLSLAEPKNPHEVCSRMLPSNSFQGRLADAVERKICAGAMRAQ